MKAHWKNITTPWSILSNNISFKTPIINHYLKNKYVFIKKSNKKSKMTIIQKTTLSISQEGIMGFGTT
jgi:hypothetical protein